MGSLTPFILNLRDLGGCVAGNGRFLRSGLLYRSEQLGHITDAEMPTFARLGLKNHSFTLGESK